MDNSAEQPKSPYHHGDLRNALIEVSLSILNNEGLEALSLRRLAREVKVSPAAPYRHFKDKQALLCSLSAYGFRQLHARLEAVRQSSPGDLDSAGQAYMEFALQEPQCYRLMFTLNLTGDNAAQEELKQAGDLTFAALCDNIHDGIRSGVISETDANQLALAAWSMVHGICMLVIDGSLADRPSAQAPPEQLLQACLAHFRQGWLKR